MSQQHQSVSYASASTNTDTHVESLKKKSADRSAPAAQHVCGADKEQEAIIVC